MPKEEKIDVAVLKTDIAYLKRDVNEIKTIYFAELKNQVKEIKDVLDANAQRWQELGGLTKGLLDLQTQVNEHAREHHVDSMEIKKELDEVKNKQWWIIGIGSAFVAIPVLYEIIHIMAR